MATNINQDDLNKIQTSVCEKFAKVAQTPAGLFAYPTGKKGLEALGYNPALIEKLPDAVTASYCGVGDPFSMGEINAGEQILDVGCGTGVDTILAAMITGSDGLAVGVDIVPEMIDRAELNLQMMALDNVKFQNTSGGNLSFPNNSFDVVISNGVINLIPDKAATLSEILRVLKPAGRMMVADQIAIGAIQKDIKARLASWFQ
jgi:arsenite methyltransferase